VSSADYTALGYNLAPKQTKSAVVFAMADTGCQSCLTGIKVIQRLGLTTKDIIPVTIKMHAANNNKDIAILGATVLRISGTDKSGRHIETRQMTYVTDNSNKMFHSREACVTLGIISDQFPTIGATNEVESSAISQQTSVENITEPPLAACGCPACQPPPPLPRALPFDATPDNCDELKNFLVQHYIQYL
jgi:hypothetical protein